MECGIDQSLSLWVTIEQSGELYIVLTLAVMVSHRDSHGDVEQSYSNHSLTTQY